MPFKVKVSIAQNTIPFLQTFTADLLRIKALEQALAHDINFWQRFFIQIIQPFWLAFWAVQWTGYRAI